MIPRNKATHKLLGVASGVLGGALAGALFKKYWRGLFEESHEVPEPTSLDRDIREC